MVDISIETDRQTEARLMQVIRSAEYKVYQNQYCFTEMRLDEFPEAVNPEALAIIRDDEVWSQLVPHDGTYDQQAFTIFRFHFQSGLDNSGFVGWLATHLKRRFGTGLFVVCGQNSKKGGIFDYWGCPTEISDEVVSEVRFLRSLDRAEVARLGL